MQTFTITVTAVNDAPSFTKGADQSVFDNAGPQTVSGWATAISPGPGEAGQTVSFVVSADDPALFTAAPSIATNGTLTYTPAIVPAGTHTAIVTVTAVDNGGTANGGVDTSAAQTFQIAITHANIPPALTTNPITYTTAGNTQLHVAGASMAGVAAVADAQGVMAKAVPTDSDGPGALSIVAASGSSANGGSYSIAADGSFTYLPPTDFTGTDSFTYQVTDTQTPTTGTISMTVTQKVWYVRDVIDANNAAGGDGRSSNAFETLAAAQSASGSGDIIYVFEGNTASTPLSGGIVLKDGQKLWGQGVNLDVSGIGTLVTAAGKPRINNTGGDAVSVPATAGNRSNVEIRGLDLQGSVNAIDVTSSGANTVGVTISGDNIRGAGSEGIDLNAGSSGAFSVTVQNNTLTSTGNGIDLRTTAAGTATLTAAGNTISASANGIDARTQGAGQTLRVALDNTTISNAATGIVIDGSAGGTTTVTSFQNNAVGANATGTGVQVTSATFDQTPGGTFQTVNAGTLAIGVSGNGVGSSGLVLTNAAGDLNFSYLDVYADGGDGFSATGTTAYTGSAGLRVVVANGVANVEAIGGAAVKAATVTLTLPLNSLRSTSSPTSGVSLDTVAGSFSAGSSSSIASTTAAATAFKVNASSAVVSYDGTINVTTGTGVSLTGNSGTIGFTGALTLSTGTNPAFVATGGGTVTANNTTSTLTTTTATALNVASTTIGAAGLKFRSISAGTAASGPTNGIVLNNTGASGSLNVLGTGSAGSGGTIQRTTGDGISLTSTLGPSFDRMIISNTAGSGVKGNGVTNFTFTNGTIDTSGTNADDSNLAFNAAVAGTENNISGTLTITGNTLQNALWHGLDVQNFNGTLSDIQVSSNTVTSSTSTTTSKGTGIRIQALGSASTAASITKGAIANNTIRNLPSGGGILVQGGNSNAAGPSGTLGTPGSGTNVISITGNSVQGLSSAVPMNTNAIAAVVAGKGQGNFNISNNGTLATPLGLNLGHTVLIAGNGLTTSTFTVSNNIIAAFNSVGSNGISGGTGITFAATDTPDMTATITNNTISQTDGIGIFMVARGATGNLKVKIQNNNVAAPLTGVRPGIRVDAGNASSANDSVCLNISGNTSAGSGGTQGIGLRKQGTVTTTNAFAVNGMAATSSPGIETYVSGLNPAGNGTLLISATSGFSNCNLP
mgnify:CR=1 FL=1